jgi:NADH-quinone oxidoreductase subunit C
VFGKAQMPFQDCVSLLKERFGSEAVTTSEFRDNRRIIVHPEHLLAMLEVLKVELGFDMVVDISAADYLNYPGAKDRFGIFYALLNVTTGERLYVKTYLNEPDLTLPSALSLWRGADWMEREVYDMFGIHFDGHPDLRRILMPEEFADFPLRKDYPLRGKGERHNLATLTRAEG